MTHPYKTAPDRSFWKRAVSDHFDPTALIRADKPLLSPSDVVMSAGSCFAANIVPYLEQAGIRYVWTERPHPAFAKVHKEAFSYHKFSAAYGNIYTVRHLRQLLERALGQFTPEEDRWHLADGVIDPFRPGLAFPASSDAEFDLMTRQHLEAVLTAIEQADVFVFTLGLTEGWVSKLDGAVFPACPGTIRGAFDPDLHTFHNFSVAEMTEDLVLAFKLMRTIKRNLRFIVSVSPVPLVATATPEHVLSATIYSKSALRVAAGEISRQLPGVTYFPAYEIVTGPQAPWEFFEPDRREPSRLAIDTVMGVFLGELAEKVPEAPRPVDASGIDAKIDQLDENADDPLAAEGTASFSAIVARAECEEAGSGL